MAKQFHVQAPEGSGPHVFIAMPVSGGLIQCPPVHCLISAIPLLVEAGIRHDVFIEAGNCHVDDARNSAAREFLKTSCTDLFFVDADVGFDPASMVKLLQYDRDLVAGVYPKKNDEPEFPVSVGEGVALQAETDGLVEVLGAPTGFMRIRRNVIERLCEEYKHRRFKGQNDGPDDPPYTCLFERTFEAGRRMSGDYAFCAKWRAIGGKVYVDPELPFTHEGLKEWGGVLGDYWRKKHGVTDARYAEAVRRLRAGDMAPELFVWLFQGWDNPWAASPAYLQAIFHVALQSRGPILECGSGITTLLLAIAAERTGFPAVSLEDDSGWIARTVTELRRFNLTADIRYSPITEYGGGRWYRVPDIGPVAAVICDGPRRDYGRQGLFELMADKIRDAVIVMDDTNDAVQLTVLEAWAERHEHAVTKLERYAVCRPRPQLVRAA